MAGALIGAALGGIIGGVASALTGGSIFEGIRDGAFTGAIAGIIAGGMAFTMAAGLGTALTIGAVSGAGSSLVSDLGDIFITGADITPGQVLSNMLISGAFGTVFGGAGRGLSTLGRRLFGRKPAAGELNFMDSSDDFARYASRRTDIDPRGTLDIVGHGSSDSLEMVINGVRQNVDFKTFANILQRNPGFQGQSIRLLSCNTGNNPCGFAQNLANRLNVKVTAPNGILWANPDGSMFVAPGRTTASGRFVPDYSKSRGGFVDFLPGGNAR